MHLNIQIFYSQIKKFRFCKQILLEIEKPISGVK